MKSLIFLLILIYNNMVFSFDRFLDINLTTDFTNLRQRSHIDFNSQAVVPFSNRAFLLSPRISIFFDGSIDASVAAGLRHQLPFGTLGHHVFWDSTGTKDAHFHQIGHSLDLLTENFDYRINYYHPISKEQQHKKWLISPHKWLEKEVIYKHRYFQIGIGPKYDLFDKIWGLQTKVMVPFKYFSIGTLLSYDNKSGYSGALSLSFRLYGTPRTSSIEIPMSHTSRVQYSKELVFIPPPENKKRSNEKDLSKETNPVENGNESSADSTPPEDPPQSKSWWDFFFRAA